MSFDLQRSVALTASLGRLSRHRLGVRNGISIGAGSGADTVWIRRHLAPEASFLMVEAQEVHRPALSVLAAEHPGLTFEICAAGREDGTVRFAASAPTGGAVSTRSEGTTEVPSRSIDSLAKERGWTGPFMLIFDTHGVEEDILQGAGETLSQTAVVMMEAYNFRLNFVGGNNKRFFEMCLHMEQLGFRCIDMCEPLFRPNDLSLWQLHLFFVRSDHPNFGSNSYSAPDPFAEV